MKETVGSHGRCIPSGIQGAMELRKTKLEPWIFVLETIPRKKVESKS